jgi:hypothetical protein
MLVTIHHFDTEGNLEYILDKHPNWSKRVGTNPMRYNNIDPYFDIVDEEGRLVGIWYPETNEHAGRGEYADHYAEYAYYIGAT